MSRFYNDNLVPTNLTNEPNSDTGWNNSRVWLIVGTILTTFLGAVLGIAVFGLFALYCLNCPQDEEQRATIIGILVAIGITGTPLAAVGLAKLVNGSRLPLGRWIIAVGLLAFTVGVSVCIFVLITFLVLLVQLGWHVDRQIIPSLLFWSLLFAAGFVLFAIEYGMWKRRLS